MEYYTAIKNAVISTSFTSNNVKNLFQGYNGDMGREMCIAIHSNSFDPLGINLFL